MKVGNIAMIAMHPDGCSLVTRSVCKCKSNADGHLNKGAPARFVGRNGVSGL
jgi:hypothetical protein